MAKPLNDINGEIGLKYNGTVMKVTKLSTGQSAYGTLNFGWPVFNFKSLCAVEDEPILGTLSGEAILKYKMERFMPKPGFVNHPTYGVVILNRGADKQWQNSYCSGIYHVVGGPNGWESLGGSTIFSEAMLAAVVKGKYYSYEKALSTVKAGVVSSCAISRELALFLKGNQILVYLLKNKIGKVTPEGVMLFNKGPVLQEILSHNGIPVVGKEISK